MAKKQLDKILQSQGFGSRKQCQQLIQVGRVRVAGQIVFDLRCQFETQNLVFELDGKHFLYRESVYLALFKPCGFECSHQPQHHRSVFGLIPDYLTQRDVQAIGRLDQDTTGLLLFSDDGQFIHQLTHPKKQVYKQYHIETANPILSSDIEQLIAGVTLHQEQGLFIAEHIIQLAENRISFEIHQGVYHQVKRMLAAIGHRVVNLHREQIGSLSLKDLALQTGEWCHLSQPQLQLITTSN